ncbi:MAG TPA: hypothetical protein VLL75_03005, partial [Vicinamibacteria bacterium]|nr:hypothetical protein [Vicinamibacteria bacterium]
MKLPRIACGFRASSAGIPADRLRKTCGNSFYWIGGLSLLNSVTQALGSDGAFLAGLGVTQVIDAVAAGIAEGTDGTAGTVVRGIGFGLDVVAASLFILLGWEARDRKRWAFL